MARAIAGIVDGAVVMIDGLIASSVPAVLVPVADRLRLVVLVHMPLGEGPAGRQVAEARTREGAVLAAARHERHVDVVLLEAAVLLRQVPGRPLDVVHPVAAEADRRRRTGSGRRFVRAYARARAKRA